MDVAVCTVSAVPTLAIETNGISSINSHTNGKRKAPHVHELAPSSACGHLPRDNDQWLREKLREKLRKARHQDITTASHTQWLSTSIEKSDDTTNQNHPHRLSLRDAHVVCLSCDFTGQREQLDDPTQCFMTHAILTNHHFALLPRKKKLFCARCLDFVYPHALLTLTQHVTPSHHSHNHSHTHHSDHQSQNQPLHHHPHHPHHPHPHHHTQRAPALRRRLLRSSARRGLVNMGNTCYLNAVLQALAHNPLLQHEFFVLRSHNTTICEQQRRRRLRDGLSLDHHDNLTRLQSISTVCMGCEMAALLQSLFPAPRATLTARHLTSPVVPQSFMESFWSHAPDFVGAHQHDAHEFLVALLNGIHSHTFSRRSSSHGVELPTTTPTTPSTAVTVPGSPQFSSSGHSLCDCVVHQNFAGVFRSDVSCVFCETTSSTFDPFLDISLALDDTPTALSSTPRKPKSSSVKTSGDHHQHKQQQPTEEPEPALSLETLLRRFTKEERLKGVNQIYCRRCSRYVDATKQLVLHKLPNLLVLHLKRLDFHRQRKITETVAFPLKGLDLHEFCGDVASPLRHHDPLATPTTTTSSSSNFSSKKKTTSRNVAAGQLSPMTPPPVSLLRDAMYDLAAVVCHHGDTATGGHFTSFVHTSMHEKGDSEWLHCDDCSVEPVASERVEQSQAYMLVYVRRRLFV